MAIQNSRIKAPHLLGLISVIIVLLTPPVILAQSVSDDIPRLVNGLPDMQ
ncbi:MAG: hypothetical protein HOG51_06535, partial [Gammaproteobacteria bacterium]|nr:hypothetical protein [Gammaproteobacteria bacterium]